MDGRAATAGDSRAIYRGRMMTGDGAESIAATYDEFGRRWAHGTSPLYEDWAVGVSQTPYLVDRIAELPHRMRQPNLLFAAARWNGCPLVPWDTAQGWFEDHWDAVVATAAERSTQTNEPNRCATLLPPLAEIDGPVALLEVGTAAGLCLYPDRYGYRYRTPSGERMLAAGAPVILECTLDADDAVPARLPDVVWRRGIDLSPIDARDPDAIAWLGTLVWPGPDHDARLSRLRGAAAVVAADPPTIVAGDLLDRLDEVAAAAPPDATLVVFHSAVLLYLDRDARERFAASIAGLAGRIDRRVMWLSNETAGTLDAIDTRLPPALESHHRFVQTRDGEPIALAGQHGATYEVTPFRR